MTIENKRIFINSLHAAICEELTQNVQLKVYSLN